MKFVIVGASGFVGRRTMAPLSAAGCAVVGTHASTSNDRLVRFDLTTERLADALPTGFFDTGGPVCVAVFSAISQLDRCRRESELSRRVNVEKTIPLLEEIAALGAWPVFISSSYVFDGRDGGYREANRPAPINEYGRQKLEVEEFLSAHLPQALVLRLDKMVGDDPADGHLFSEWHRCLRAQLPITCIADQILSPTLADDVGRALILAAEHHLRGVYHLANPEAWDRAELAREFVRAAGSDVPVVARPMEEFGFDDPRPLKSYLDGSRFIDTTGMRFTPMKEAIETFLSRLGGKRSI